MINFQSQAGSPGENEFPLFESQGLFEYAGLQLEVKMLQSDGRRGAGDQVGRCQKTGAEVGGVGSQLYLVGFGQSGDLPEFGYFAF